MRLVPAVMLLGLCLLGDALSGACHAQTPAIAATTPGAAEYEAGQGALKREAYDAALTDFTKAAAAGNVNAMNSLGILYYEGQGVPKDDRTAFSWYLAAANGGHVDAMWALAFLCKHGYGTSKSLADAAGWARKSATLGGRSAMTMLGTIYLDGGPVSAAEARSWLAKAETLGAANARSLREAVDARDPPPAAATPDRAAAMSMSMRLQKCLDAGRADCGAAQLRQEACREQGGPDCLSDGVDSPVPPTLSGKTDLYDPAKADAGKAAQRQQDQTRMVEQLLILQQQMPNGAGGGHAAAGRSGTAPATAPRPAAGGWQTSDSIPACDVRGNCTPGYNGR